MKFFDECAGRYRYRHKGLGVVLDTLMAIRKKFTRGATEVAKKSVKVAAEKVAARRQLEKGLRKFNNYCRNATPKRQVCPQSDAMLKLSRIMANQL